MKPLTSKNIFQKKKPILSKLSAKINGVWRYTTLDALLAASLCELKIEKITKNKFYLMNCEFGISLESDTIPGSPREYGRKGDLLSINKLNQYSRLNPALIGAIFPTENRGRKATNQVFFGIQNSNLDATARRVGDARRSIARNSNLIKNFAIASPPLGAVYFLAKGLGLTNSTKIIFDLKGVKDLEKQRLEQTMMNKPAQSNRYTSCGCKPTETNCNCK